MGTSSERRTVRRHRLTRPMEADLLLCDADTARGRVENQQDAGVGVLLQASEALKVWLHKDCCVGGTVRLRVQDENGSPSVLPVRLVHVTPDPHDSRSCRAGIALDAKSLDARHIEKLLTLWGQLQSRAG